MYKQTSRNVESSKGFIYLTTTGGITGGKGSLDYKLIKNNIDFIRWIQRETKTNTPILVGFGITRPEQVAKLVEIGADSFVVSSHLLRVVKYKTSDKVIEYIRSLKSAGRRKTARSNETVAHIRLSTTL